MSNYNLEIVSHLPPFNGKTLKKHYVNGIETVGAYGDEPFEVRFKNNTWQKVQVKLSIDGTDIFTGKPADTTTTDKMWVVGAHETLSLRAWPESNNGGAAFVFTSAGNSVAIHTHGDLSNRGIIAAAVFTEGHVEPVRLNPPVVIHQHYPYPANPIWYNTTTTNTVSTKSFGRRSKRICSDASEISSNSNAGASMDCFYLDNERSVSDGRASKKLESLVAVGAGQHVDQKITYVNGLIKPTFAQTVRVRYQWWTELQEELRAANVPAPHPSGFPGDDNAGINLGNTPRLPGGGVFRQAETNSYQRI